MYHPPTRPHDVEAGIDLDQLGKAVGSPTDDPNAASPHSKTDRDSANRDRMNDLSAREVDAGNALIDGVRDPEAAVAERERRRCNADSDLVRDAIRAGVDARDLVARDVRPRYGVIAQGEDRGGRHGDDSCRGEDDDEHPLVAEHCGPRPRLRPSACCGTWPFG